MFEVLLTLCLAGAPAECRTERLPGGETRAACEARALALAGEHPVGGEEIAQDWPCVAAGADTGFTLTRVADGVYVHKGAHALVSPENRGDIANLGLIVGERSAAVIDTGGSAAVGRSFLEAVRAVTDLPVSHAVLTHMHPDHVFGASVFAAEGAEIVGHRRLPRALGARGGGYLEANAERIGPAFEGTALPRVDETVEETRLIDLGGRVLELTAHPTAHTEADLTVIDRQTGTIFLGDLLFLGHLPVIDGSLLGWMTLADDLAARRFARAVPGHGPVAVAWPEGAAPLRAYLAHLAEVTRAEIAAGAPIGRASERIAGATPPGWLLTGDFAPRNALTAFTELEWE